ncbi:MAG TPA: c-type cytochrome [Woeseiaceae bacterium]|nr:c-type cytochrome [Woeseiaceae bacterium]
MNRKILCLLTLGSILVAVGCTRSATSPAGFRLPDGDADRGRAAFLYMQCHQCHTVAGEEFPELPYAEAPYVSLGGPVSKVKTYGELVTAIINPSHELAKGYAKELVSEDGESNMYNYNEHMTVQELTDLVAYLQSHYDVVIPQYDYRLYP